MKSNRTHLPALIFLFFALFILATACAPNWPQFRGPEQDMVVRAGKLPDTWGDTTNIRWTAPMEGEAWSSPLVLVDKVFTSTSVPVKVTSVPENREDAPDGEEPRDPPYTSDIYRWEVSCHSLKTGELLWNSVAFEGSPRIPKHRAHNYAGETPVTDGKRLYAYFGMVGVYCFDLRGNLLWEKDLGAYPTLRDWGTGSSPVIHGDLLYIKVDNEEQSFITALSTRNGEEVWRADREEKTTYSTPYLWENRARTELVTCGQTARSYDPETGELLWELKMNGHYSIPSAVGDRDYLYLGNTAFRDTPGTLFCVRAGSEGDITPAEGETESEGVMWSHGDAPTANPSPLLYEGYLYLVSSRGGEITCYNAFTGELVYQEKIDGVAGCWASPWAYDGEISFTDQKGVTRVFRAGKQFELLRENSLDDTFWASMAAARDAYVMKGEEMLYCIGE